jgi:hypothetical protein
MLYLAFSQMHFPILESGSNAAAFRGKTKNLTKLLRSPQLLTLDRNFASVHNWCKAGNGTVCMQESGGGHRERG